MIQQGQQGLPLHQGMVLVAPQEMDKVDHELGQEKTTIKSLPDLAHQVPINRSMEREVAVPAEINHYLGHCQENCLIYNIQVKAMKELNRN